MRRYEEEEEPSPMEWEIWQKLCRQKIAADEILANWLSKPKTRKPVEPLPLP